MLIIKTLAIFSMNFFQDSLPPNEILFQSLRTFHASQRDARTAEYQIKDEAEKRTWRDFVPGVGVGYNLQGQPRPTIAYNFSEKFEAEKRRKTEKLLRGAKINSILMQSEIEFKADSLTLVSLLKRLEILKSGLNLLETQERIEDRIFELNKEKWKKSQIRDVDWWQIEIDYLARGETLRTKRENIQLLELEAEKAAKY
jgi:hypothetical protein